MQATVIFLITSSLLVTSRQYIGDPIDCIVDQDIPQNVMDTYCWIHATFTIPNRLSANIGQEVPHPGVAPGANDEKKYHKYYQWVCFTLFFQAGLFYTPRSECIVFAILHRNVYSTTAQFFVGLL